MNCVERCGKFDEGVLAMFDTWYRWWIRDLGEACKKVEDVRNFGRFEDIWRLRIRRETRRDLERWKLGLGDWESLRNVDNIDGRDVNQLEEKWHWRIKDLRRLEILEEHRREWRIEWHNSWWLRIMEEVWKLKNTVLRKIKGLWGRRDGITEERNHQHICYLILSLLEEWRGLTRRRKYDAEMQSWGKPKRREWQNRMGCKAWQMYLSNKLRKESLERNCNVYHD